jgi:hypothetical protein
LRRSVENFKFSSPLAIGLREATRGAKDPIDAIVKRARRLLREAGLNEPPFRPALLAPLRRVTAIVRKRMEEEGRLVPTSSGFRIELRTDRSFQRTNFTCAHEISHTFFYEATPEIKYRRIKDSLRDAEEEMLCNIGASEMLMPRDSIKTIAKDYYPSPVSLKEIAAMYNTSLTATTVRVLGLGVWTAKFVLWECDDENARAAWYARPSALIHYPQVDLQDYQTSGIRAAFRSNELVKSEDVLCINRRYTTCSISSVRLENSARVLSCIAPPPPQTTSRPNSDLQIVIPEDYNCECHGTGSRIVYRNGYSYAEPCRAAIHRN